VVEETSHAVKKPRRIWLKLVAIVAGLLVVSEIAVRVIAVLSSSSENEAPHVDDLGLRGFQQMLARIPDDPNILRVVFLGDSYTRGVEGIKPEQTLVHHVGVALEKWKPGRYVTINLGVSGSDSLGEWGLYNRLRESARADVLVHVISPRGLDLDVAQELRDLQEWSNRRIWLSRVSILSDMIEEKARTALVRPRLIAYLSGGATEEERSKAWRVFSREIVTTKRLAEEGGAVYVMVRFPLVGWAGSYPLEDVHRRGAALAADLKLPYLDLLEPLRSHDLAKLGVYEGDLHPGVESHVIAGKAVTDFLTQSILPNIPSPTTNRARRPRTLKEIGDAETRHYLEILHQDPNCLGAKAWLLKYSEEGKTLKE